MGLKTYIHTVLSHRKVVPLGDSWSSYLEPKDLGCFPFNTLGFIFLIETASHKAQWCEVEVSVFKVAVAEEAQALTRS